MRRKITDKERLDWLLAPFRGGSTHWLGKSVDANWDKFLDAYYTGKLNGVRKIIDAEIRKTTKGRGK